MKQANLCLSRREIDSELATSITNMDVRQFLLTNLAELEINNKEGVKQRWRWRCNLDALEKSVNIFVFFNTLIVINVIDHSMKYFVMPRLI
jgi:hypothetical protein